MSFFHDIESDGITGLHGIHALISWAIMRYGYRGLNYRDDDIFSIYRAALADIENSCAPHPGFEPTTFSAAGWRSNKPFS